MSRLKMLLPVANPSTRNTQQPLLQPCKAVAQHMHTTQQTLLHVVRPSTGNTQQTASVGCRATEARRQRVLAMLADNQALRLAVVCDGQGDPVPVAVAIRDKGVCELLIPAAHFDPFTVLDLVERHSGTVH